MNNTTMEIVESERIRRLIRRGEWSQATSGAAPGYVQCNLAILQSDWAAEFLRFCQLNPKPCPLIAMSESPGDYLLPTLGKDIDIRFDVPRYRIWRDGELVEECEQIDTLWSNDMVAFLLGCSFSFEEALLADGLEIRNITEACNVPMYRTNMRCAKAGRLEADMVVSMRPMKAEHAIRAIQICTRFPSVHGAPVHLGDPALIGIADINRPDYGDRVTIRADELPVFWACGVTPQVAIERARPALSITHSPGYMLISDLLNSNLAVL